MIGLMLAFALLACFGWLIWRATAHSACFRALPRGALADPPLLSIIIPARNEESTIANCLAALVAQSYPPDRREIIVVDDGSTDRTAILAAGFAHAGVRIIAAPPLPAGWTGKSHACRIGVAAADPRAEALVFLDADVCAEPDLLASATTYARASATPFLSVAPRLVLCGVAERLVIPCGLFVLAFLQDLKQVEAGKDARATGQFMMIERQLYDHLGGHEAVRDVICEDLGLARLALTSGARVEMRDGGKLASVRMYEDWRALRAGLSKNVIETLGGRRRAATLAILAIVFAWSPVVMTLATLAASSSHDPVSYVAAGASAIALIVAVAFHVAGALHFRIPPIYGLFFPLGYSLCALLCLDGLVRRRTGRTEWKGRLYPDAR